MMALRAGTAFACAARRANLLERAQHRIDQLDADRWLRHCIERLRRCSDRGLFSLLVRRRCGARALDVAAEEGLAGKFAADEGDLALGGRRGGHLLAAGHFCRCDRLLFLRGGRGRDLGVMTRCTRARK